MSSKNYQEFDAEGREPTRKRSLVRPERQRWDKNNPRFHYTQVASQEASHLKISPSSTGSDPIPDQDTMNGTEMAEDESIPLMDMTSQQIPTRGKEVFGLNDEYSANQNAKRFGHTGVVSRSKQTEQPERSNIYFWKVYAYVITFWAPGPILSLFGIKGKSRQFAWREKVALISCILYIGAFVAYLTFGFRQTVCSTGNKLHFGKLSSDDLIINGRFYDLSNSQHPPASGIPAQSNVLYPPVNAGGTDASFLFQNVNGNCKDLIKPRGNCSIPFEGSDLAWYMPCRFFSKYGSKEVNNSDVYYKGWACHTSANAREVYYNLKVGGDVFYTWDDIRNSSRNLVVYSGTVLDLDLIDWISKDDVTYPDLFNQLKDDESYKGHDISMVLSSTNHRKAAKCLSEIVKVGIIDSESIGCISSQIVLIVSLVFILSVVVAKFVMALYFRWVVAVKQGADLAPEQSMVAREREIEQWVGSPAPLIDYKSQKTNRQSVFFKNSTQMLDSDPSDPSDPVQPSGKHKYTTMGTQAALSGVSGVSGNMKKNKGQKRHSRHSSLDLLSRPMSHMSVNPFEHVDDETLGLSPELIHPDVIPQPPVSHQPFGCPLAHCITLITAYSEDHEGLRTTMDSVATTEYPNSHKLMLVVCDGIIQGSGNTRTTPEIALELMTDFTVPREEVQPFSYVAVAQGSRRHNMAKVYAGFYKYDDATVPPEKQQRVPVITIVKCGTPAEAGGSKPGNRGKRDSQIILMSFLQKITFNERMTALDHVLLESIWRVTGLMADFYELVLMVDADTMVYPDCIAHMSAEMVKDPSIMGLCGETKIANKNQSWVTMIQVFEYYISHHQAKAFESVFGGVTCLPGCFCMYRIKAPKGSSGYWVPILANPDIVERYSDNVVDTLHKKNLLLLGEDRFLSSLMLRTFPKRKQVFVPKAACKTIVPDKFSVLLSQRRRWINSTVHNLMELVLVRDLCGTFCFSMQFVIFIELVGTLVLPAAISFTFYVVVISIVKKPTQVQPLVLLGVIFGLPGALIVVTVSSIKYVVYFFIYLVALPIWNFVLPTYAYWKFDDFSWGETRTVSGGDKGDKGDHSALEGVFDSSSITMKRWREWERERRNRNRNQGNVLWPGAVWNPAIHEKDNSLSEGSVVANPELV